MIDKIICADLIFWDFDGVIKESVSIKGEAFQSLFASSDKSLKEKILIHHHNNGGTSRYEKIKTYLRWAGLPYEDNVVNDFAKKFSVIVKDKVIQSRWVPCVKDYISNNSNRQIFALVTATPDSEIKEILKLLNFRGNFDFVFGAPITKEAAIKEALLRTKINKDKAIFVGDAYSDYIAAKKNNIDFVLRTHEHNKDLAIKLDSCSISNFCEED